MPHFDGEIALDVWPAVTPITGNSNNGGCAYDGNGKALYAVYDGSGAMKCYRTIGSATTLITEDDSVAELSTIVSGAFSGVNAVCLTVVAGTLYATVTGHNTTANRAGTWLYRDTSGQSGAGPWVKHGTMHEMTPSGLDADPPIFGHTYGSEVFVLASGRWIASWAQTHQTNYGGTQRVKMDCGFGYSDDSGATWTLTLYVRQGGIGGLAYDGIVFGAPTWGSVSIDSGQRSFGIFDGKVYAAVPNNSGGQGHWYTTDGITWTKYALGSPYSGGGNGVYRHPLSDDSRIFRAGANTGFASATAAPETNPTYTTLSALGLGSTTFSDIAFCDIGGSTNRVVATRYGKVQGIGIVPGGGWVVGSASFG